MTARQDVDAIRRELSDLERESRQRIETAGSKEERRVAQEQDYQLRQRLARLAAALSRVAQEIRS